MNITDQIKSRLSLIRERIHKRAKMRKMKAIEAKIDAAFKSAPGPYGQDSRVEPCALHAYSVYRAECPDQYIKYCWRSCFKIKHVFRVGVIETRVIEAFKREQK